MDERHIRIEAATLFGETSPTYFIDLVENNSSKNLRSTNDEDEARAMAASYATRNGLKVISECGEEVAQ